LLAAPSAAGPFFRPVLLGCVVLMTTALGLYAMTPFVRLRLPWRYALNVIALPVYMIWKFRVTARGRPDRWVRTPRESRAGGSTQLVDKAP
jgi:hypothetical protein